MKYVSEQSRKWVRESEWISGGSREEVSEWVNDWLSEWVGEGEEVSKQGRELVNELKGNQLTSLEKLTKTGLSSWFPNHLAHHEFFCKEKVKPITLVTNTGTTLTWENWQNKRKPGNTKSYEHYKVLTPVFSQNHIRIARCYHFTTPGAATICSNHCFVFLSPIPNLF